eukprot:595692-Pelagomonas_calceolata.AAC.1
MRRGRRRRGSMLLRSSGRDPWGEHWFTGVEDDTEQNLGHKTFQLLKGEQRNSPNRACEASPADIFVHVWQTALYSECA